MTLASMQESGVHAVVSMYRGTWTYKDERDTLSLYQRK